MGPQRFRRGDPDCERGEITKRSLQWGRNVSVAEISIASVSPRRAKKLQWGRNVSVAEIRRTTSRYLGPIPASMGPQRFRRGDDNHKQRVCAVGCASMGPQRFRRGDSDLHLSAGYLIVLQWGRNVSVAEIPTGVTTTGGSVTASMGPQRFRRGDHRASPLRATGALASMGPQRFRRGDSAWTRSIVLTSTLQWGRNVSVAEMDGRGTSVTPVRVLQWGRNVSVAEITERVPCGQRARSLQWGRNVSVAEIAHGRGLSS